jgi:hypothetical protein
LQEEERHRYVTDRARGRRVVRHLVLDVRRLYLLPPSP